MNSAHLRLRRSNKSTLHFQSFCSQPAAGRQERVEYCVSWCMYIKMHASKVLQNLFTVGFTHACINATDIVHICSVHTRTHTRIIHMCTHTHASPPFTQHLDNPCNSRLQIVLEDHFSSSVISSLHLRQDRPTHSTHFWSDWPSETQRVHPPCHWPIQQSVPWLHPHWCHSWTRPRAGSCTRDTRQRQQMRLPQHTVRMPFQCYPKIQNLFHLHTFYTCIQ